MLKNPSRYLQKHFYSTSSDKKAGKMHVELSDIATDEEIEFEVRRPLEIPMKLLVTLAKFSG
jgi:hypothetical protein